MLFLACFRAFMSGRFHFRVALVLRCLFFLHAGATSTGFREAEPSFSAQVNLLESTAPSSSLARDLERMEKKRDLDASNLVKEASFLFRCHGSAQLIS